MCANYFISRSAGVNEVGEEDGVLGARETTSCNFTGTLLNGDPLVVLVEGLAGRGRGEDEGWREKCTVVWDNFAANKSFFPLEILPHGHTQCSRLESSVVGSNPTKGNFSLEKGVVLGGIELCASLCLVTSLSFTYIFKITPKHND